MRYRTFGNTDLEVSEICYGTMRYVSKEGVDDESSRLGKRALEEAIDHGVNFIHSSYEYKTRWATGEVLARHPKRHELHHIIKVNAPTWNEPTFDKKSFRTQVEEALRDLHTERIAVVQHLHRAIVSKDKLYDAGSDAERSKGLTDAIESVREVFDELKAQGKVGYLTAFPYTVEVARAALATKAYDGMVAYYNAFETEMLEFFPAMRKRGMGFIGIRPFLGGLFTDRRADRSSLPAGDRMLASEWDERYQQFDEIKELVGDQVESWTQFAVKLSLADPLVASTVVSVNEPDQLRPILEACDGDYPDAQTLEAIHQVNQKYGRSA